MTESRRVWKRFLGLLVVLSWLPALVSAQPAAAPASPEGADVRIVVDISGSMRVNDPDNLRRPAVRLLARMMPQGAGSGLWLFGQQVNMLVPFRAVDDDWRRDMLAASEQISSVALRTNLGAALEQASDAWIGRDFEGPTHVILLTDGLPDISPDPAVNDRERTRIAEELAHALARRGVIIHGIALSAEADLDLMGVLADITGGSAHVAPTAEALSRVFADALGQVAARDEVPIRGNRFRIDDDVEEFTALIFSDRALNERRLALVSPTNSTYSVGADDGRVAWVADTDYDLITITDPAPGEWRIDGDLGSGSRVTVVSDLRLVVEPIPSRFRLGESVEVRASFQEDSTVIVDPEFLGVFRVVLSLTMADGRAGARVLAEDAPPRDGIYRDTIARLQEPGTYLLELEADGRTFSRKFRQSLTLVDPDSDQPAIAVPVTPLPREADPAPEPPPAPAPITPVDTSLVEVPTPSAAEPAVTQPEPASTLLGQLLPWRWWIIGAAGGLVLLGVLLWALVRRRRSDPEPDTRPASTEVVADEPETDQIGSTDTDEAPEDAGVVAAQQEVPVLSEDLAEAEPEPVAEPEEDLSQSQEQDEVFEAELQRIADEVSENVPEPEPEPQPRREEDSLPLMDDELAPEDLDDEEFGLEDFDLSDIDDLPTLDPESRPTPERRPEDEPRKPSKP